MGFLFIQCSNSEQLGFSVDIKKHFGDMRYREVIIPNNTDFNPKSDLQSIKSQGTVKDKLSKPINYRWYIIADNKGEIGGFYLGTDKMNSINPVKMSREEAKRRLAHCKEDVPITDDDKEFKQCIDLLVGQILDDCFMKGATADGCAEHCWYNDFNCGQL